MSDKTSIKLPKALRSARDTREIFRYLFRKAALWPEFGMAPPSGVVRRIVLLTEGFNDRTVDVLERIPNVSNLVEGLEELRLVMTAISKRGVARLRVLFPKVRIVEISAHQWRENVNTGDPRYNLETKELDIPLEDTKEDQNLEADFLRRYGHIPDFLRRIQNE